MKKQEIANFYKNGMPVVDIAKHFSVSVSYINYVLRKTTGIEEIKREVKEKRKTREFKTYKIKQVTFTCPKCGTQKIVRPSYLKYRRFCSVSCANTKLPIETDGPRNYTNKDYLRKKGNLYYHTVLKKRPDFKELTRERNARYLAKKKLK